jgi:hypothetical protein
MKSLIGKTFAILSIGAAVLTASPSLAMPNMPTNGWSNGWNNGWSSNGFNSGTSATDGYALRVIGIELPR